MKNAFPVLFLSLLSASACAAEWFTPHATYNCDVASAYISRGKVCENRPIQINEADVHFDLADFGRLGFWHWNYSSLNGKYDHEHRRFIPECDWGVYYGYDWRFAEGWSLDTEVMVEWMTFHGGRPENDPSSYEWRMKQSLKNPYVTPYYKVRYTLRPVEYAYYQVGLKRKFKVCDRVSVTPNAAIDFADSDGRRKRFGAKADGTPYGSGVLSTILELTVEFKVTDYLSLHGTVGQFDIMCRDGRDNVEHTYQRDLTYGQIGFTLSF